MISPYLALSSSCRQVVERGAGLPGWQAKSLAAAWRQLRWQPFGAGLFAGIPASSLGRGLASTPSVFLGLRANSSRRAAR